MHLHWRLFLHIYVLQVYDFHLVFRSPNSFPEVKAVGREWTGLIWVRIGTSGGLCMISGFRRVVSEICTFLGFYVVLYRCFRTNYSFLKGQAWPLKMEPLGCPKTSVRNCHFTLRKIPKEHRSQVVGSRDCSSEPSASVKCGEFLDLLRNC
jgi:hypothetical protein